MDLSRRPLLALLLLVFLAAPFRAQQDEEIPFDYVQFQAHLVTAGWLLAYDRAAWITSDLVLAEPDEVRRRLGGEWFCLEHRKRWHAFYGSYDPETDRYDIVRSYTETDDGFERNPNPLKQKKWLPLVRALYHADERMRPILGGVDLKFNQYVRHIAGGRIEVWLLPGWQVDGRFVFGVEYRLVLDPQGRRILEESIPELELLAGNLKEDTELVISNDDADVPSVGQLFALMLARKHVRLAAIRNRDYLTTLVELESTGETAWFHIAKGYDPDQSAAAREMLEAEESTDE